MILCARCHVEIYIGEDDHPDAECTSTFVGDLERALHSRCYVAELATPQMVLL